MKKDEVVKEIAKWAIGIVFAVIVLLAAIYSIVNPMVQGLVKKVQEQTETLAVEQHKLGQQKATLVEMEKSRIEVEKLLAEWKKQVGPLISDQTLTNDLRSALTALSAMPPEQRTFVAWMADEPKRMDARLVPIVIGLENLYSHTRQTKEAAYDNLVTPAYKFYTELYNIDPKSGKHPYPLELKK